MSEEVRAQSEADTRSRVMRAALEEFYLWGYKGTSTKRIAERAGVNEVTIFRHFGCKSELLRAAAEQAFQELSIPIPGEEYLRLPLRASLSKFIGAYLEMPGGQTDLFTLGMSESFAQPQMAELFKSYAWQNRVNLAEYFRQMHSAGKLRETNFSVLAHIVLSAVYSLVMVKRRAPEKVSRDLKDEEVLACLVNGIACAYGAEPEGGEGEESKDQD
ncbi:Bacterial regulatory proteins, tetR family [Acididesulfobacillus acetoxydans]|uniref:Bacterial regulatory proteins, tetR family n=1 Tax=Acididesulfobacillus acetoxydans TaxID=1561005 RepID=A0A8S0XA95_9FIRM|nr:TetR/AcrR family transcriptional regulator [Acididesulfobacillus acetoxydans]CAA7599606.1 Bacterial regulatory proteins, tetR family [Acididesulfobacillus acetoxydans]CEJ06484.1 TetR bacterial regulatory protein HTH signature [Acididesulfobacillus acetoxydans]